MTVSLHECPRSELRDTLERTHERLAHEFDVFVTAAKMCDHERMTEAFSALESDLAAHMAMEEELMFPLFALEADHEAAALRAEHHHIRGLLNQIGLDLELHELDAVRIEEFIRVLRQHAERENLRLYPWIDSRLRSQNKHRIVDRVRAVLQGTDDQNDEPSA